MANFGTYREGCLNALSTERGSRKFSDKETLTNAKRYFGSDEKLLRLKMYIWHEKCVCVYARGKDEDYDHSELKRRFNWQRGWKSSNQVHAMWHQVHTVQHQEGCLQGEPIILKKMHKSPKAKEKMLPWHNPRELLVVIIPPVFVNTHLLHWSWYSVPWNTTEDIFKFLSLAGWWKEWGEDNTELGWGGKFSTFVIIILIMH